MSDLPALAILALVPLASLFLVLVFLSIAYLKGGKDDLRAAADAVNKIRSTAGVAAIVRALAEALRAIKRP